MTITNIIYVLRYPRVSNEFRKMTPTIEAKNEATIPKTPSNALQIISFSSDPQTQ